MSKTMRTPNRLRHANLRKGKYGAKSEAKPKRVPKLRKPKALRGRI